MSGTAEAAALAAPVDLPRLSRAIRDGERSCAEAVAACLERAERTEPQVRAYLHLAPEEALAQAEALDAELAAGRWRGPLHGIPVAAKDVIDVAGMPTTGGSRVPDRVPAERDAAIVAALRAAGAILVGKANTHEFANGATTPPTRNPHDPARIAGGSSGGSGAAVAAGSAVAALGTDTGGSVRIPAALCGVAGLRPRLPGPAGLPGTEGIVSLVREYDQWGLFASDAAGVALLWEALTGERRDTAGPELRIGIPTPALEQLDPGVGACVDAAIRRIAGATVAEVPLGRFDEYVLPRFVVQMRQALPVYRARGWWPDRRDRFGDEVRGNLEAGEALDAAAEADARRALAELDATVDAVLAGVDVLALPTVPIPAPRADELPDVVADRAGYQTVTGALSLATRPFSRPDLASLSVPAGMVGGLPAGLQLVARTESLAIEAALRLT